MQRRPSWEKSRLTSGWSSSWILYLSKAQTSMRQGRSTNAPRRPYRIVPSEDSVYLISGVLTICMHRTGDEVALPRPTTFRNAMKVNHLVTFIFRYRPLGEFLVAERLPLVNFLQEYCKPMGSHPHPSLLQRVTNALPLQTM